MRVLTSSTILGTSLVALAILNFSVLDQIGVGLVEGVDAKFSELGAEWMGLQLVSTQIDPQELASGLASIPGVKQTLAYWTTTQAAPSTTGQPSMHQWVMTGDDYDLHRHPYLFVFQEDSETQAKFYRDGITWLDGTPPEAGEVAVSADYADENGYRVGDPIIQSFGAFGGPFGQQTGWNATFAISGIYDRAYTDATSNPADVIFVGPDEQMKNALRAGFRGGQSRNITVVQATITNILDVSDRVVDYAESQGFNVSTEQFQIGGRTFGGRQGGGGPPPGGLGGGGQLQGPGGAVPGQGPGTAFSPPDMVLFANGEVLASALDAAENAGLWFRFLTSSAVLMAILGIAFVTAAMEKKVRRDVGIRQAVGYPVKRIYMHWAFVATTMGLVGAAVGIGLVYAISSLGLASPILGMDIGFRPSVGLLVAPLASVLIYALATLPTYHRVLRASPVENLRALLE